MKKVILIIALGLALAGGSAFAYERDSSRDDNRNGTIARGDRLDWRVDRLNRMLRHVRSQLSRYHGDWRLRRQVNRISEDVNRVNRRHNQGYDGRWIRREVDRLRDELHRIEQQMHVRQGDWYRWD